MLRVLFLRTGNSCRSRMAEGWARHLKGDLIDAYSAGVATHGMNPHAVAVMSEPGVAITPQHSKHLDQLADIEFDYVVTVCDNAGESCPVFRGKAEVVHKPFDDPPRLAREAASKEEAMSQYRRVRDEIRDYVTTIPGAFNGVDHGEWY